MPEKKSIISLSTSLPVSVSKFTAEYVSYGRCCWFMSVALNVINMRSSLNSFAPVQDEYGYVVCVRVYQIQGFFRLTLAICKRSQPQA